MSRKREDGEILKKRGQKGDKEDKSITYLSKRKTRPKQITHRRHTENTAGKKTKGWMGMMEHNGRWTTKQGGGEEYRIKERENEKDINIGGKRRNG